MKLSQAEIYQTVTDRIIDMLEAGTVPWRKSWSQYSDDGSPAMPANFHSKKQYHGINAFTLACSPYACPYYLTQKQIEKKGGKIKAGQKPAPVIFWTFLNVEDAKTKEMKTMPYMRLSMVYNLEQVDGIEYQIPGATEQFHFDKIEAAELIINGMPNRPEIHHFKQSAYYSPAADAVNMPKPATFEHPEKYYSTLLHELVHSTGHISRLNRFKEEKSECSFFGSHDYSKEELVAEMGSAFLCADAGIENATIENSAAYIQNWLIVLKNDRKMIFWAATRAQKAANYILSGSGDNAPVQAVKIENKPSFTRTENATLTKRRSMLAKRTSRKR